MEGRPQKHLALILARELASQLATATFIADAAGIASAIWVVAAITAASGVVVLIRMRETRFAPRCGRPSATESQREWDRCRPR